MKIMLDTNVLFSSILFPSERMNKLMYFITKYHRLVLCSYILDELQRAVERKMPNKMPDIELFLAKLPYTFIRTPSIDLLKNAIAIRDKKDYPILLSAIFADVDILITGDKDFENIEIEKPEIMTPTAFVNKYCG